MINNKKKLFLHGGSSLISKYLLRKFFHEFDEFYIFCRNISKTKSIIEFEKYNNKDFFFFENDLNDFNSTLEDLKKLPDDFSAIFWITGYTGNPEDEYLNLELISKNLNINFYNAVLSLTYLSKKIIKEKNSFICVITSVAGLRGRKKRLFYSSAKAGLINFLSGLRQKLNNKVNVITVIPGYISTNSFNEKASKFLVTSPEKSSEIIFKGIKANRSVIYVNNLWKYIMWIISLIPEKIFKKLKF